MNAVLTEKGKMLTGSVNNDYLPFKFKNRE